MKIVATLGDYIASQEAEEFGIRSIEIVAGTKKADLVLFLQSLSDDYVVGCVECSIHDDAALVTFVEKRP